MLPKVSLSKSFSDFVFDKKGFHWILQMFQYFWGWVDKSAVQMHSLGIAWNTGIDKTSSI